MKAPFIGIRRHCINTDGRGINTLAAFHGCRLRCKYCLNPQSIEADGIVAHLSPQELLEIVGIDNLYFLATDGGITFGGGEPLLQADFIKEFRSICNPKWRVNVETSLNVDLQVLADMSDVVDCFIIDIKDSNPTIYKSYTGMDNTQVFKNLKYLCDNNFYHKIAVRVPRIKGFNEQYDISRSVERLMSMGIMDINVFDYVVK